MQGRILEDGFIEAENGEKYYIYLKNISNILIAKNHSLVGWHVNFRLHNGVACDIVLHDSETILQKELDSTESILTQSTLITDKAVFRKRVFTMLICKFILFPFVIPIFIAAYNQFLLTKQIAIQSNSKKLIFYFLYHLAVFIFLCF